MKVTLLLCDNAQTSPDNKLYAFGAGWTVTTAGAAPSGIAGMIEVPWDRTDDSHQWRLELVTADGQAVTVQGPEGEQALLVEGEISTGRPPGWIHGAPVPIPLAINFGPLPLEHGARYEWRFTIGGESDDNWRLPFATRPMPPAPTSYGPASF